MAGVSNTQTPLVFATENSLSMLFYEYDSVNTKKQISYAVNRMKVFASGAGVSSIKTISETVLRVVWSDFTPDQGRGTARIM